MKVIEIVVAVIAIIIYLIFWLLAVFTMLGSNEKIRRRWFK